MEMVTLLLGLMWSGCALYVGLGSLVLLLERQGSPGLTAAGLARLLRETGALWLNNLLAPLGLLDPGPRPIAREGGPPGRPPVLLLPGHGRNRSTLFFLAAALRWRGWRWVWATNNAPVSGGIPDMAEGLAARVERMLRASGAEQVDLVCHSMGGLVAAWYIRHLGGHTRVRRLVTIGTPWRGTRLAALSPRVSAVGMRPGAALLDQVTALPIPVTSIWTTEDTIIIPPESSAPEWLASVALPDLGHEQMLTSPAVLDRVVSALGEAA